MSATHNHGFSYLLVNPVVAKVHAGESSWRRRYTGRACGRMPRDYEYIHVIGTHGCAARYSYER